jgi:hypothetical protein
MKGWLDNFGKADNANDSNVSLPEGFVGLGYNTKGRNYSPAWGGQFQKGGNLVPVSPMEQVQQSVQPTPTVPYLQTKDPVEFYQSWIQSPEYARRQLLTGYSPSAEDESISVPSAAASRQIRLESLQNIDPITYSTRQPSESRPGVYGIPSTVNINPLDYIDTNRGMVEAHELAHIAGAMESEGTTRPGVMSAKEQEIFKKSMLPMKEPVLSGSQGSQQREASRRALEDFEHSKKPKELKADLDALRFTMYDKGIYDITKGQKFTESDFEKAKQSLGKDRVFKRLENRVGKKNFVNLMNTIAKADEEELPLAMGGMSIPGSVGFTYARTGSTPSNGKYAKKTMASAQIGKNIEKDETNIDTNIASKIAGLELKQNPEYHYRKYLQNQPQLKQAPGRGEELMRQGLGYADVVTDVMQMGNFIPLPQTQTIGKIGNIAGSIVDLTQAAMAAYNKDYQSALINAASAGLPFAIKNPNILGGYNRSAKYAFGNRSSYLPVDKLYGRMTAKQLLGNRALLGILGAETAYDAGVIGPVKKEYGGDIPSAQNGQEMKFYQNGLDWKPRSMQDGGEQDLVGKATKFVSEGISGPVTTAALGLLNMVKPISNSEIYKTIRPVGYPNALKLPVYAYDYLMGNESEPLKTKSGKPHLAEEFWATAMSMPGERQYLKESKYKPSVAKDPDAKYYTIRDIIDQDALIGAAKDLKAGEKMEMNGLLPILDSKWYSENADTDKNVKFGDIDPLQRFTLQKSPDGSYVSIYDKYDFNNPALNKRMNPIEIYDRFYLPKKRKGGVIKDNRGQWAHPGEVTEIDSNYITMEGVPYDVVGVSDAGDTKLMKPGKNYKFKGKKVTEFPVAELGINQLDAQPMKKLNQLLNFTNNPDKDNWLDKYN